MMNAKPFWQSTTFHGLFLSVIGLVLTIAARKGLLGGENASDIVELIGYAAQLLGLPYAGYGRAKTNGEKIVLRKPEP